jgi:ribosome assembly protein 1
VAQSTRVPKILYPDLSVAQKEPTSKLERDLYSCNSSDDANVVAYVGKMFAVKRSDLPEIKRKQLTAEEMRTRPREARSQISTAEDDQNAANESKSPDVEHSSDNVNAEDGEDTILLGFARLFSGVLRNGSYVYCILPKYNSKLSPGHARNREHIVKAKIDALYLMMGRDLEPVDTVRAGNVFAIRGLQNKVWRSATLCAEKAGSLLEGEPTQNDSCLVNLGGVNRHVRPLIIPHYARLTYQAGFADRSCRIGTRRAW